MIVKVVKTILAIIGALVVLLAAVLGALSTVNWRGY